MRPADLLTQGWQGHWLSFQQMLMGQAHTDSSANELPPPRLGAAMFWPCAAEEEMGFKAASSYKAM